MKGNNKMDKKAINKTEWVSNFNLIGKPVINDYTFKINEKSEKSNWIYNALNLGIDCGEKHGVVYSEMLGGYSEDNESKIFVRGKDDNNQDDFNKQIIVSWEDRFNDEVLKKIGDMSFLTCGLEKTSEGKTYYKKFLSAYDAIAYVKEHLTEDMVVNVKGRLAYSTYNDNTQVRKTITSIVLSKVDDPSNYKATFTQSVLIDKDSASLKDIDKDRGIMYVNTRVLDYVKEVNGIEVKGQYPYHKQFEFELDLSNEKLCKTVYEKLFKVKKDITQINFEGEFIEGGAVTTVTWDDVPDDIKDLVAMNLYTKEDALAKCTANRNRERRMVLKKPAIKLVGEDKVPVVQKFEGKYTEDDLVLDYLNDFNPVDDDEELPFATDDTESDDSMSWLNSL